MNDIFKMDFTETLPAILKEDKDFYALAQVIYEKLKETAFLTKLAIIYARIDELDEKVLDTLAYDMHVDWYDYSFSLDIKRKVIKSSIKVHKYLGTKFSVETLIKDVFGEGFVTEWFEYNGNPYHFKIATAGQSTENGFKLFEAMIGKVKNVRSVLEQIDIIVKSVSFFYLKSGETTSVRNQVSSGRKSHKTNIYIKSGETNTLKNKTTAPRKENGAVVYIKSSCVSSVINYTGG